MQIFGQIKAVQLQLFGRNYNKLQNTTVDSRSCWTGILKNYLVFGFICLQLRIYDNKYIVSLLLTDVICDAGCDISLNLSWN